MTDVVQHQWVNGEPSVDIKLITNSKSINFEIKVTGAKNVEDAMTLLKQAHSECLKAFPTQPVITVIKE